MKKYLILIACTLLGFSGMSAQTDVTSTCIKNPSFEQNGTDGWTVSGLVTQGNNSFEKKVGGTYLEKWVAKGSSVGTASISQVISPNEPGRYTLIMSAQNLDQNNTTKKCTGAQVYADKNSTIVYTPDDYSVDFTYISGEIEIGFKTTNANGNWLALDNVRLIYNGVPEKDDIKTALSTLVTSASKSYGDGTGNNASDLKKSIDDAQASMNNDASTAEELVSAYKSLTSALDKYALDNVSETNPIDYTKYITNPSFEVKASDGWTNAGLVNQSNSSFTKKKGNTYMEKWTDKGKAVGSASISQVIKNLPDGQYKLIVAAQNLDQNSTSKKCTGASIFVDNLTTSVYTPNDYSIKFTSITGEVTIGYRAENATGNWLAVDNFRLYLIGTVNKADVVGEIQRLVGEAEKIGAEQISTSIKDALNTAIEHGKAVNEETADADIHKIKKELDSAIADAKTSAELFGTLHAAIEDAQKLYDAEKEGAAEFKNAIETASEDYASGKNADIIKESINALTKAVLAFRIANATHGSGTAVKVTKTNTYAPTGSTEALMRATMTGSNILEKGICWSEDRNPTVLDERTTEYHSLNGEIYHIRGLKSATVYYLRPYVMNKTYEVAYGDEVKIVTHPKGTCTGSWDNGAPDDAANTRCRNAINETIEYFNQWTGIKGFNLSGHYGAQTPTADCSYGGWMRIGPNAGNQAIGTVIHETGHGVGVGTSSRWSDTNVHNWKWYGREANAMYSFLEGKTADPYNSEFCMVGDGTHGWGASASYDWFVNGADKDKHSELQYLGGCCLLYALFVDGLCPTTAYTNGLAGYTYNFDSDKKYYIMNKNAERGLGEGILYQRTSTALGWNYFFDGEEITDSAAWKIEYNPSTGYYQFKNAATGRYMTHAASGTSVTMKSTTKPTSTESFQLMPDRTDVTVGSGTKKIKTHGYWFTWNDSGNKAMESQAMGKTGYGANKIVSFDFSDKATQQQWIIISEDEIDAFKDVYIATGIKPVTLNEKANDKTVTGIYTTSGTSLNSTQPGINIIRYSDGTSKKIYIK